jgi:hypothetical protein
MDGSFEEQTFCKESLEPPAPLLGTPYSSMVTPWFHSFSNQ